jgi:hypothetical protein
MIVASLGNIDVAERNADNQRRIAFDRIPRRFEVLDTSHRNIIDTIRIRFDQYLATIVDKLAILQCSRSTQAIVNESNFKFTYR